jgi:hypothetical protein
LAFAGTITGYTNPALFPANDGIYWGQVGTCNLNLPGVFTVTSANGLGVTVSVPAGHLITTEEQSAGCSWGGNFNSAASLVATFSGPEPVTLTFSSPIAGFGAQIENNFGPSEYAAEIQAFNGSGLLATTSAVGYNVPIDDGDGSALFLGISDTSPLITSVVLSVYDPNTGDPEAFAINGPSLEDQSVPATAPEPSSLTLVMAGLLALVALSWHPAAVAPFALCAKSAREVGEIRNR